MSGHAKFSKFQTPEFRAQRLWNSLGVNIEIVESQQRNSI